MTDGEDDEPLSDEDQERIDRVRGKRRSRQRGRSSTQDEQEQQPPEAEQAPQAEQREQEQQENRDETENSQTEAPQAQQEPMDSQATEATEAAQAPQEQQTAQEDKADLTPVTQREHDTFYLSEGVRAELNRAYRRVALDVLEETGIDIDDQQIGGRNRYFRPLALLLGARRLEEMSPEELRETIKAEDLVDDLPEE